MGRGNGPLDGRLVLAGMAAQQAAPGVAAHADQLAAEQVLRGGQLLGQVGHSPGELALAPAGQRASVEVQLALAGRLLAGQQLEQGRLARAVVADQAVHSATLEGQLGGGEQRPVGDGETGSAQFEHAGRSFVSPERGVRWALPYPG